MNRYRMMMFISVMILFIVFPVSAQVKTGNVITFGHYEQDNDLSNGAEPIEWQVLTEEEGRMLLLSRYGLDGQPYHSSFAEITWENSLLRQWLNGEFFETAFTDTERDGIEQVVNRTPANPEAGTDGGNDTADSVFLLSMEEAREYYACDEERIAHATPFAKAGAEAAPWRLRSPGYKGGCFNAFVRGDGMINTYGCLNEQHGFGVRPAMWIRL